MVPEEKSFHAGYFQDRLNLKSEGNGMCIFFYEQGGRTARKHNPSRYIVV